MIEHPHILLNEEAAIIEWLREYKVKKYTLRLENGQIVVDAGFKVDLRRCELDAIAVQFGSVDGDFDVMSNKITSLKGCPKTIHGSFFCDSNQLTSLQWGPEVVSGAYSCDSNLLENLIGAPLISHDNFYATNNKLKSLEGCPVEIYGSMWLSENKIADLSFFPAIVKGQVHLYKNLLLGEHQKVKDFETLKNYHIEFKKALEQKKALEMSIGSNTRESLTSSYKI